MKIGISSYSFAQYIRAGKLDNLSIIAKAAEMGFEAIEYIGLPGDTMEQRLALAAQIKAEAARCGLDVSSYVVGGNLLQETEAAQLAEVERLKGELDIARALGVTLFRFDVLYKLPPHRTFGWVLQQVAPAMKQITEYGKSLGIKTSIENHGLAFQDYDRIERTVEAVDHDNFGLLIDIGNFLCADQDNIQCVSRLAHLAYHVHLKDFIRIDYYSDQSKEHAFQTRGGNYLLGVAVGDGEAKTKQCMDILKKAGYDGYVIIEFEGPKDCISEIQRGLEFYRKQVQ